MQTTGLSNSASIAECRCGVNDQDVVRLAVGEVYDFGCLAQAPLVIGGVHAIAGVCIT